MTATGPALYCLRADQFWSGDGGRQPPDTKEARMRRKPVQIDDLPADGFELAEDQLATMLGGLPPAGGAGSSKTQVKDGGPVDKDTDF
jgi:hypothetical protein